ncbi:MAG: NAD-dependent epimerase/dehydratase family protein [Candidatus Omnitrophica bacterium]|nr:NAD-dependent epimerase/dehydratase family protein [Candidatus Omnitrophota bacterium]
MNILITGGGGFIGRRLAKVLLSTGHNIKVLDNFKIGSRDRLLGSGIESAVVEIDIRDYDDVRQALSGMDMVYHLAAPSSFLMFEEDPVESSDITIKGFINVLEGMRQEGIKRIIYLSTSAVYEGNDLPYSEDMNIDPPDLKSLTKKFNEEAAGHYFKRYGIRCMGVRPFSVFGYGEETKEGYANVISLFAWAMLERQRPIIWGDGTQTRDFIFVDDVVEALVRANDLNFENEIINLGTGKETSFNEVVQMINDRLGTSLEPIYVPVPINIYALRLLADVTKQKKVLGFDPRITVKDGIAKTIEYIRSTKDRYELQAHQLYFSRQR